MTEHPNRAVGPIASEEDAQHVRDRLEGWRAMPAAERAAVIAELIRDEEARLAAWEKGRAEGTGDER